MEEEEWKGVWEQTRANIQKKRKIYIQCKNQLWPWNLTEFFTVSLLRGEGGGISPQTQEPV